MITPEAIERARRLRNEPPAVKAIRREMALLAMDCLESRREYEEGTGTKEASDAVISHPTPGRRKG